MNKNKRIAIYFLLMIVLIILDRVTKNLAVSFLKDKPAIDIIPGALELFYLPNGNTGAAFGMLQGHQGLFIMIAVVVVALIGFVLYNMPFDKKFTFINIMLCLIAAGGIGNMIDRAMTAYVVDFIYFSLINFPIFNVADIYVSVATVLLVIYMLFVIKEDDVKEIETALKQAIKRNNK